MARSTKVGTLRGVTAPLHVPLPVCRANPPSPHSCRVQSWTICTPAQIGSQELLLRGCEGRVAPPV